ncbi:MAG TPA: MFS transporter [Dehalococcoidia bacterium]|nr:MFS transporter [Dehalococcoidia bacterium]
MAQEVAVRDAAALPPDTAAQAKFKTFHSLRYRDYRFLWLGQVGAAASLWMEQLARPLLMLSLTDSAFLVGLVTATRMVPMLLVGIWAGVIADRADKRQILLVTKSVTLLTHLTTAAVILTGVIEPWMVFVTTFIGGSAMAFDQPARQSLIPRLVPRESIANAVALNSAAMNVMRIAGASAAGLVLAVFDYGELYLLQSLIYVGVLASLFQINFRRSEQDSTRRQQTSALADLREGFAAVRRDSVILYVLGLSLILFVWGFPYQTVFVPLIAKRALELGDAGAGLLVALTGAGALLGSLTIATAGDTLGRRGLVMLGQIALFSLGLLLFSRAEVLLLVVPALLLTGAMQTSFMSLNNAFVLGRTPPELQGRIMSLFSLDRGLIPLGATVGGLLAEALGPQDALTIMASICLACTLLVAAFVPTIRRIH